MDSPKRLLVAGAGFLGLELMASAAAHGWEVVGLRRELPQEEAEESGYTWVRGDLCQPESLALVAREQEKFDWLIHCASSGRRGVDRYREVYLDGCRNLAQAFPSARLGFTSSTSVYGQTDGAWVDENSPTEPERETAQVLLETEKLVCELGGTVLRLAGLYGNERSVLYSRFLKGEAIIEKGVSRWINQIHVWDAAQAWMTLLNADRSQVEGAVFNCSDGNPLTQRGVQEFLAQYFENALPPEAQPDPNRKRGLTSKRVDAGKLAALGWKPRWSSFAEAVRGGGVG